MPTIKRRYKVGPRNQTDLWFLPDPQSEAVGMYCLVQHGHSIESVRRAIGIDQQTMKQWESVKIPSLRRRLNEMVAFRGRVLAYFDGLVKLNALQGNETKA